MMVDSGVSRQRNHHHPVLCTTDYRSSLAGHVTSVHDPKFLALYMYRCTLSRRLCIESVGLGAGMDSCHEACPSPDEWR